MTASCGLLNGGEVARENLGKVFSEIISHRFRVTREIFTMSLLGSKPTSHHYNFPEMSSRWGFSDVGTTFTSGAHLSPDLAEMHWNIPR